MVVGHCSGGPGGAAAWVSENGYGWVKVIDDPIYSFAYGAAPDGLGAAVVVGEDGNGNDAVVWEAGSHGAYTGRNLPATGAYTVAVNVARGSTSLMIVGNSFPHGPDGDTRPWAWIRLDGDTAWTLIDPAPDADEFVDVTTDEGGNGYRVFGYTHDVKPAVWDYSVDGTWTTTILPMEDTSEIELRKSIDADAVLDDQTIWTKEADSWSATSLTDYLFGAYAGVRMNVGSVDAGRMITGKSRSGTSFIYSADSVHWTAMPDQPQYHDDYWLIDSLAALPDRVIAMGEDQVLIGPIPTS